MGQHQYSVNVNWGVLDWRHLVNTIDPSVWGGSAALLLVVAVLILLLNACFLRCFDVSLVCQEGRLIKHISKA